MTDSILPDINDENRQLVWYSFRHSLGTPMANEGGIEQAKEQLHKSLESILKYPPLARQAARDAQSNWIE